MPWTADVTTPMTHPTVVGGDRRATGTVLLATDLTAASDDATTQAISLARQLRARLLVVNVLETHRLTGEGRHDRVDQARAEREDALLAVVRRARDAGAAAEFLVWTGEPGSGITAAAEAEAADLVVVGSRGLDRAGRLFLGSVSDEVIRTANCPVLVVRAGLRSPSHVSG